MGNNCFSRLARIRIFQCVLRFKPQKKSKRGDEDEKHSASNPKKSAEDPKTATMKPPEPMKIDRKESKLLRQQSSSSSSRPSSLHGAKRQASKLFRQQSSRMRGQPPKQSAGGGEHVLKRASSLGVQLEFVLKRKTRDLKEQYSMGRKLGHGQFGTTFACVEKASGRSYACKSIAKRKLVSRADVEDVRREIEIMHHLKGHPNVVSIKEVFEDAVGVHIVMELCSGGELFDRIVERGHYSERKAADLGRTIIGVVEECHAFGVIHRDLKPENFLFVNEDEDSPLKAIDFGLSIFFNPGDFFTQVVGSPYYVAPEVLSKHYGAEADVWTTGVIIYILLCGVPPFWAETEEGIFEQVLHGGLDFSEEPWPNISNQAKDLVRRMLVRDPAKRLTAHQALCHPWIMADGVAPDKPLDPAILSRLKLFSAMNKLKKIALRVLGLSYFNLVIAEMLSEEEIAGLKKMFEAIDTDHSGHITFEELKTGLNKFGANLEECEIHNLMQAADIDESGAIDYGEFIASMLHLNKLDKEDHLLAAFSFFDKDASGYITRDELQQACQQFGIKDMYLEDLIKEIDQDNDGRIDYNEFVAMMQLQNLHNNFNAGVIQVAEAIERSDPQFMFNREIQTVKR